ncbi:hypothetical protein ACFL4E_02280 [Candidatus Omnitrophota bacterium]
MKIKILSVLLSVFLAGTVCASTCLAAGSQGKSKKPASVDEETAVQKFRAEEQSKSIEAKQNINREKEINQRSEGQKN